MTYGISAIDANTARYVQAMQAADGLSFSDVSGLYNTSVFGANTGFGYASIPFAGGINSTQMLEYQRQLNNNNYELNRQNIDNNLRLSEQQKAASYRNNASENSISRQIASLQRQVQANNQDNIMTEYNKLLEAVAQFYQNSGYTMSEQDIKATAEQMYSRVTGSPLVNDIKGYGSSSFVQGFKRVASLGLVSGRSANDNISEITGENANNRLDKANKVAGGIAGGVTIGVAAKGIFKFLKSQAGKSTLKAIKNFLIH